MTILNYTDYNFVHIRGLTNTSAFYFFQPCISSMSTAEQNGLSMCIGALVMYREINWSLGFRSHVAPG